MVSRLDRATARLNHLSVNACLAPVVSMHGQAVTTVEGIGQASTLHSHWSGSDETWLSLVESFLILLALLCHIDPARASLIAGYLLHKDSWLPSTERIFSRRPSAIKSKLGSLQAPCWFLWHKHRWLPRTERIYYRRFHALKNLLRARNDPSGLGMPELVRYGIR